jgi:4-hydroxybenzoate polyprenyltransferase/phosphoserine phosphatase
MAKSASAENLHSVQLPLCVDLDGTLVHTDTLLESVFALPLNRNMLKCFFALFAGRAVFKKRVAESCVFDPALLPYNHRLLAYLRQQHAEGREIILATAADILTARRVADHLQIFADVIASDGGENLKGRAKARILATRFGEKRFAYVGNSRADLPVWQAASAGIIVNAPRQVANVARKLTLVETVIDDRSSRLAAMVRAMRPHQWIKNILVFVPIVTAHATADVKGLLNTLIAFLAFCATASGIYLINDISDLAADRRHPRKCKRPFASGAAPLHAGAVLAALLLCAGLFLARASHVLPIVAIYAALSVIYSAKLRKLAVVDVFVLATLYGTRLFAGGLASGYAVSLWLLAFASFLFLSLALIKRVAELKGFGGMESNVAGRGYNPGDVALLQTFGCGSAVAASMVLALFVQNEAATNRYASPGLLWCLVPLILFWQFNLWFATSRGQMKDDPITYAAGDWVTWLVGAMSLVVLIAAKSVLLR